MRPYRKERVARVVRQVVGDAILHRLQDPRIEPLTTVTRVAMTGDLSIAKVYLSIQGDEATERRTLRAVRHAAGFIQRTLARELPVRQCPELRFDLDQGVKEARRTMELLAENQRVESECLAGDTAEGQGAADTSGTDDPGNGVCPRTDEGSRE